MKPSIVLSLIAASGIAYATSQLSPPTRNGSTQPAIPNLRVMLLDMHKRQIELLKVNWGTPVLCTEWSQGYDPKTQSCGSDDLMRLLPGNGCEYGLGWVIDEILKEELSPVNTADAFEDSMRSCYEEKVQVGWMTLDAVSVMKEMDPTSWSLAQSEWESEELDAGSFYSPDNGSTIYEMRDVERFIEDEA